MPTATPQTVAQWNAIWDGISANRDRLNACPSHAFVEPLFAETLLGKQWQCTICRGEVTNIEKYWYELGRSHRD